MWRPSSAHMCAGTLASLRDPIHLGFTARRRAEDSHRHRRCPRAGVWGGGGGVPNETPASEDAQPKHGNPQYFGAMADGRGLLG